MTSIGWRVRLSLALSCASLVACPRPAQIVESPTPATSIPEPVMSHPVEAPPPPSSEPAIREATRHGPLHGAPILVDGQAGGKQTWLALLGNESSARAAWLIKIEGDRATSSLVRGFPRGAKLEGQLVRDGVLHLLLVSTAALDQPAGLHGVFRVALDQRNRSPEGPLPLELTLSQARDPRTLAGLLDSLARAPAPKPIPGPAALTGQLSYAARGALADAGLSIDALLRALTSSSAEIVRLHQGVFPRRIPLSRTSSRASPEVLRAFEIARGANETTDCPGGVCTIGASDGASITVELVEEDGKLRIRTILDDRLGAVSTLPSGPRRAITTESGPSELGDVLREQDDQPFRVLAEASMGPSVRVGVVLMLGQESEQEMRLVLRDGDVRASFRMLGLEPGAPTPEIRFADLDGDGRPDVLLRTAVALAAKTGFRHQTFLSPTSLDAAWLEDPTTMAVTLEAKSVDDAVTSALRIAQQGGSRDEFCQLLGTLRKPSDLARVAVPGARLVSYDEPGSAWYHHATKSLLAANATDFAHLTQTCTSWVCDPRRPSCWVNNAPGLDVISFARSGGRLRIAGAMIYTGS